MKTYDVVIIGGGPGGYVCGIKAAQLGLSVALVEKEALGGTCLNWGCIPMKSLLRNAEVVETIRDSASFGVTIATGGLSIDYSAAHARSREVSERLSKGVEFLMKKNTIEVFRDEAVIVGPRRVELKRSGTYLECRKLVLATGTDSIGLFGIEPDGVRVLSPRQALDLRAIPPNTAIIGAGAIGMEFASIWNSYGSKVTIIEALDRLLPKEDEDVGRELELQFTKRGVESLTQCRVEGIGVLDDGVLISLRKKDGSSQSIRKDAVLFALGVRPKLQSGWTETLGLRLDGTFIEVDERMMSSVEGIYAIGDVTGKLPLAHVASAQGIIAAKAIAGFPTESITYRNVPRCTYCLPEVASIGFTEKEALAAGHIVRKAVFPLSVNGKALASGESRGFVKILSDSGTKEIIGVHMVGAHVTELIGGLSLAMRLETTSDELSSVIFPHPTISESIVEAAHVLQGEAIHI